VMQASCHSVEHRGKLITEVESNGESGLCRQFGSLYYVIELPIDLVIHMSSIISLYT
jgi:hypothetical protein